MKYFIISFCDYGIISNYMLEDLKKLDNVVFLYEKKYHATFKNRRMKKLAAYTGQLFYRLFKKRRLIRKIIKDKDCENESKTAVVTNEALLNIGLPELNRLKKAGITVKLLLIDPMCADYPSVNVAKKSIQLFRFNEIISFDPKDSLKYGFRYTNTLYSKFEVDTKNENTKDLFYLGGVKNRFNMMLELKQLMIENNVRSDVRLLGLNEEQVGIIGAEYSIKEYMPYDEMLCRMLSSKCILDITQEGQSGVTLRYYEAVAYNKKLLTNNENIKNMPFYDERYMKFYKSFKDIDWEWVKNGEQPKFGYKNEFSPIHIIKEING